MERENSNNFDINTQYKEVNNLRNRYSFFLLAITASAIAFSTKQVDDRAFELQLVPLGITIILWLLSFYFGCKHIEYGHKLDKCIFMLAVQQRNNEVTIKEEALITGSELVDNSFKRQFKTLVLGAIFYIIWQIIEMYIRTINL